MRISRNIVFVILICCLLFGAHLAWASMGETAAGVGKNAVAASLGLVKTIGYSLKLIGEVILFPFTLF